MTKSTRFPWQRGKRRPALFVPIRKKHWVHAQATLGTETKTIFSSVKADNGLKVIIRDRPFDFNYLYTIQKKKKKKKKKKKRSHPNVYLNKAK